MNEIDLYSQPSYSDSVKLYHITENYKDDRILNFKFREKPTDTPLLIHDITNKLSMKRFKLPIRNLFFTYAKPLNMTAMRVIPLGDSVQYFYHPDVEDFTAWLYDNVYNLINIEIEDFHSQYSFEESILTLEHIWQDALDSGKGLVETRDTLIKQYTKVMDDELAIKLTKRILVLLVSRLTNYIEDIRYTTVIDDIPNDTESEIMLYAPDDIYLKANKK